MATEFNYEGAAKADHELGWCMKQLIAWDDCAEYHKRNHRAGVKLTVAAFLKDNELFYHDCPCGQATMHGQDEEFVRAGGSDG